MVLHLVAGLTEEYDTVATMIQQSDPLLPIYKACSMLTLEEANKERQKRDISSSDTAVVTTNKSPHNFDNDGQY